MVKFTNQGMVAFFSPVFPGSVHDMPIFKMMFPAYELFLLKSPEEMPITDSLPNQLSWALLADKGYVGADEQVRCLVPIKSNGPLTQEEKDYNASLVSARVICENFYGRMKQKFKCHSDCYRGDPKHYEIFSDICVALTNFDLIQRPLRQEDYSFYSKLIKNDRKKKQEKKAKRRDRYLERKTRQRDGPENPFTEATPRSTIQLRNWLRATQ